MVKAHKIHRFYVTFLKLQIYLGYVSLHWVPQLRLKFVLFVQMCGCFGMIQQRRLYIFLNNCCNPIKQPSPLASYHFLISLKCFKVFSQTHCNYIHKMCGSTSMCHTHVLFVCVAQTDHELPHLLLVPADTSKRCSVMSFYAKLIYALRVLSIKC